MRGEHGPGGPGFSPWQIEGALNDVGATDQQKQQIENIMLDMMKDVMPAARDFHETRGDLAKLLERPDRRRRGGREAALRQALPRSTRCRRR